MSYNAEADERRRFYQDSLTQEESFSAKLLAQLHFAVQDEADLRVGERIVGDIDDRGYFTDSIEAIASELDVPIEQVERFAFYEQAQESFAIVQTGDTRTYANIIIKKGVTPLQSS